MEELFRCLHEWMLVQFDGDLEEGTYATVLVMVVFLMLAIFLVVFLSLWCLCRFTLNKNYQKDFSEYKDKID